MLEAVGYIQCRINCIHLHFEPEPKQLHRAGERKTHGNYICFKLRTTDFK